MNTVNPTCKYCNSIKTIKYGTVYSKYRERNQRYKCNNCNRTFVLDDRRCHENRQERMATLFKEMTDGKSLRGAARSAEISPSTALRWARIINSQLPDIHDISAELSGQRIHVAVIVDEMWHFIDKKQNKLWIIKAIDKYTGKIIGYVIGNRDAETFQRLYDKVASIGNIIWYSDAWDTFDKVIGENGSKHYIGKQYTHLIESHNSNTRHFTARFHRRTKVVSRSREMVDIAIKFTFLRHDYPDLVQAYLAPRYRPLRAA